MAAETPLRPVIVREHLDDRFARAWSRPIVLMEGALGAGKSIALDGYLRRRPEPFARFALPSEHVTMFGFVSGLADVLRPHTRGAHPLSAIASELVEANPNPGLALVAWLRD